MSLIDDINEEVARLRNNATALEAVINGPASGANSDVPLPLGGTQITLAKALAQIGIPDDYVSYVAPQGRTAAEQLQARLNIGVDLTQIVQVIPQVFSNAQKIQAQTNLDLTKTVQYNDQEADYNAAEKAQARENINVHHRPDIPVYERRIWFEDEEILTVGPFNKRWLGYMTHDTVIRKSFLDIFREPLDVGGGSGGSGTPILEVYIVIEDELADGTIASSITIKLADFRPNTLNWREFTGHNINIPKGRKLSILTLGDEGFFGLHVHLYNKA